MFNEVVERLIRSGMTESEIASRVGSTQPSINRIRRGKQKSVEYQMGDALLKLLDERTGGDGGAGPPRSEPPDPKSQPAGGEEGGGRSSRSSGSSSGSESGSAVSDAGRRRVPARDLFDEEAA